MDDEVTPEKLDVQALRKFLAGTGKVTWYDQSGTTTRAPSSANEREREI